MSLFTALREQLSCLYIPVTLCCMHGLRRGEALSPCWQDINFNAGTASIRASVVEAAPLGVVMKNVKTRQSADTISPSDSVLTELRELRDRRRATDMYCEGAPNVEGVTP